MCLSGCFGFHVQAQNRLTEQEIERIETEAGKLAATWREDSIRRASELFQQAALHWKNLHQLSRSARCLRRIARFKLMLADDSSALNNLQRSLFLERKSNNVGGQADSLSLLTIVSIKLNQIEKSKLYHRQALKLAEKTRQPGILARAFFASGAFYYNERNFPKMLEQLQNALRLFQEAGDYDGQAETLIELAYSYIINNNRIRGRECAENARQIAADIGNLRSETLALIVLGDAYQRIGHLQAAFAVFQEAQKKFPENLDFFERGILYNRLGFYYLAYNQLRQAQFFFQTSYENFEKINNSEGRSELLTEIAQIAAREGDLDKSMSYFARSREIAERANDPITLAILDLKMGEIQFNAGNLSQAEKYFQHAARYYQKIGLNYLLADTYLKLGQVYEKSLQFDRAKEKYSAALQINRKVLSKFAEAQVLYNLANLFDSRNQRDLALDNINESIKLTESSQGETDNNQLRQSFLSNVYDRYELYIRLLMQKYEQLPAENFAVQALQASEKVRSRSLLETLRLSEANFTRDADPELVNREKELLGLLNLRKDTLTELLSRSAERNEIEKVENEIGNLTHELEEIRAIFKQKSPIYSAIKNPPPFEVGEFQQNVLDDKTLLLEFSLGEKESYLWLVGKTEITHYTLPSEKTLDERVEKIRRTFEERGKTPDEEIEAYQKRQAELDRTFDREAKLLSNELLGQAAEKIINKRLIIVPDGKLHYLPLTALPAPNSDEPLIARHEIVYEPSASLLTLLSKMPAKKIPAKDLLVFADPVFSDDDNRLNAGAENQNPLSSILGLNFRDFRLTDGNGKIPRLFASQDEAVSIEKIVGKDQTVIAAGFEANRERVLDADIGDYRILHFATHGLVDVERPEVSSIVLSQFDVNGKKREGFLRLQDIYALNLAADLVVLSACRSGVGKEIKGEGLMSLNNAFLQAGAKTVLSSAWKVDDYATAELMKLFYQGLTDEHLTPAEALRRAQLQMRRNPQFSSPFYWAAFTVQGEYRHSVFSPKTDYRYYFGIVLLAIILFGLYWKFKASPALSE